MPVTRSASIKPSSRHSAITSSPRRKPSASTSGTQHSNVIVLSDGEDRPVEKSKNSSSKKTNDKKRGKARAKPLVPIGEVFEISSEDERPAQPFSIIADLQNQVQKLQKENASLKTARKLEVDKTKITLDISQVEDSVSCEICTSTLWRPFMLPECGHTFCQSCLEDWFNTTLAQHMAVHPNYNPNQFNLPGYMRDLVTHNNVIPQLRLQVEQLFQQYQSAPQYTCPTCREQVKNKPVEDFSLKSLVKAIAGAAGESTPKKSGGKSKSGMKPPGRPWDAFFRTVV